MRDYPEIAVEKAMTRQEIILRVYAKKLNWIEAAQIMGLSCRHLRRVRENYEKVGFSGLFDSRLGKESPRRIPVETVEEVLRLYREEYFDFNVKHFHEKLEEKHAIKLSYTWVKNLLQGAGLAAKEKPRKKHRRKRERKPMRGMMLHIDGSHHQWFAEDERWHDLIVILDDATSEIYYAQLVEAESTISILAGLREVVKKEGVFCSLYSDRASHFWLTPKAGEPVDRQSLTQVGRALRELRITMIPAYSPQARGRSERSFRTWQGRLPQELRIRNITSLEAANRFLKTYVREFNKRFASEAADPEATAFVPSIRTDLDHIFSIQSQRTVNRDNTVKYNNLTLQIDRQTWRSSMERCHVTVYQHLDGTISIGYGPQILGRYASDGLPLKLTVRPTRESKPKRLAAPPPIRQTGHLTC